MKTKNGNLPGIEVRSLACSVCTPEQLKSLNSNVATTLAFRYLRPVDEHDREDAFHGLIALCLKARGDLCVWPTGIERAKGETVMDRTREFVEDFVLAYFKRYEGQTEQQILAAALGSKFRYIGHAVKGKMVDEIRRRTAVKNQEPYCESLEGLLQDQDAEGISVAPDYQGATGSSAPLDFVKARKLGVTAVGEKNYEVLEAAAGVLSLSQHVPAQPHRDPARNLQILDGSRECGHRRHGCHACGGNHVRPLRPGRT